MMTESPFHRGEQFIQKRLGVNDQMERFGQKVIRSYLPDQHMTFYQQLSYVFAGSVDEKGWPWASIIIGDPGFISCPDPKFLSVDAATISGDPLQQSLKYGKKVGMLGIELATRRRNRLSGTVIATTDNEFSLKIDQSFGNCPQYIQTRTPNKDSDQTLSTKQSNFTTLNNYAKKLIEQSDTLFVASYVSNALSGSDFGAAEGVDVSHRGGKPGFVKVEDDKVLKIPDYAGNFHFNTLGNLLENPKAGLLFIDFNKGHLLMLTGRAEILWDYPNLEFFEGAERVWAFSLVHGVLLENALPHTWSAPLFSINSELTGTWREAELKREADKFRHEWRQHVVTRVEKESSDITSFYLKPSTTAGDTRRDIMHSENSAKAHFNAGQFLTLKGTIDGKETIRTYTLSSAPNDEEYRISVKKDGVFSQYLHGNLTPGISIDAKSPTGDFFVTTPHKRPIVLIAAGVGITPMVSILRDLLFTQLKKRQALPVTLIAVARSAEERAFFKELSELASRLVQANIIWCLTQPESHLVQGQDYDHHGRLTEQVLQAHLPQGKESDVYICGPTPFMQSTYTWLRKLDIPDNQIHAEAFGPSSLQRELGSHASVDYADEALVSVLDRKGNHLLEQHWQRSDGTLLNFLETHGVEPNFGCRSGRCGSCRAKRLKGNVLHSSPPSSDLKDDEILLCVAKPSATDSSNDTQLVIELIE
ncbi:FAD-binding oxidoreductase [Aurantivibrio plasticivorans]